MRPGEIPRGAQLLTSVRQAPGGGRDLSASPDGQIYRRSDAGWYRREASGGWSFFAPTQGRVEAGRVVAAQGGQAASLGNLNRPRPGGNVVAARAQALGSRGPDSGSEARAQEVAALERQYYARALAQMRAQNYGAYTRANRPVRAGGRRR